MAAFTTDAWTSRANESYLALSLHYIDVNFEIEKYTLGLRELTESHTGIYLSSIIKEILEEWDIKLGIEGFDIKKCFCF